MKRKKILPTAIVINPYDGPLPQVIAIHTIKDYYETPNGTMLVLKDGKEREVKDSVSKFDRLYKE
jgi:hypothetical protein